MTYRYIYNATTGTHQFFKFRTGKDAHDFAMHRIELAWKNAHKISVKSIQRYELPKGNWRKTSELDTFNGAQLIAR